jgi:hypothetical protein
MSTNLAQLEAEEARIRKTALENHSGATTGTD